MHRDAQGRVDLVEKDLNLTVALRLREVLQAKGYGTALDRATDTAVNAPGADANGDGQVDDADEIQARLDQLNAAGADFYVSIHFNGFDSPDVRGTATYYCPDRPFGAENRRLAGLVHEGVVARLRAAGAQVSDKGVQNDAALGKPGGHLMTLGPATYRISRPAKMPGVLVESLFLTNEYDAGLLKNKASMEAITQGIALAIEAYAPAPAASLTVATATRVPAPQAPPADAAKEIVRGPAGNMISLTFDMGSGADSTPAILDALAKHGVKTTFFMTGQWIEAFPAMAKRIIDEGHEPANHSYSHPDFTTVSDEKAIAEVRGMEQALFKATGQRSTHWFRMPFGVRDERTLRLVASLGYRSVYWTLDSADWRPELPASTIQNRVISQTTPGAIVVMHGDSPQTAQVLDAEIAVLKAKGLEPVSLTRLMGQ